MSDRHIVDAVLLRAIAEIVGLIDEEHWAELHARGVDAVLCVTPDKLPEGKLSEGRRVVQRIFAELGKECLTAEELAKKTKYSIKGGYFNETLAELVREGRLVNEGKGYRLP